ncbi:aspartate kinase [Robertmurraya massiliosenegalensis]|uniref:aspartate kinase n=1 Tax=Robertmurraya massiliosenegalensis TaxID=1287657 RepID=UPI0002F65A71|nr:aspartate kinase [Robertmurraya massiliosenegalensis]
MKVVKFGGSSLATGSQLKKVLSIVESDSTRKIIVVSAPGKRFAGDIKVTDLLIECARKALNGEDVTESVSSVIERYESIALELQLSFEIIEEIRSHLLNLLNAEKRSSNHFVDAIKASGEDNHAKLVANYFQKRGLNAKYINPKDAGLFVTNETGHAQVLPESYEHLYSLREQSGVLVFPGFFGYTKEGVIATFSRSGSDITGSILANGVRADLYENFTDVDAVYSVNPNIVENPNEISELTYREMRELSYAGFSVFHDEALIPAFRAGIPVNVKNTNNPSAPGTRIVSRRVQNNGPVVGIASDKGFCSIYVSKYLMNREIGFGRKLLTILEQFEISYEHIPSGIDEITIILRQDQLHSETEEDILERIKSELNADEVKMEHNISLIMIVGEGMKQNVGITARAAKALANAGVNIEMINQGSSEVSLMFGVKEANEKKAVKAIYEEFFAPVLV